MKSDDAFDKVMKSVKRVRDPGAKPEEDLKEMDRYVCDLCQGVFGRKEIKQCGFCGRWICDDCWNDELKACQSCSGLILLATVGKKKEEEDEQS